MHPRHTKVSVTFRPMGHRCCYSAGYCRTNSCCVRLSPDYRLHDYARKFHFVFHYDFMLKLMRNIPILPFSLDEKTPERHNIVDVGADDQPYYFERLKSFEMLTSLVWEKSPVRYVLMRLRTWRTLRINSCNMDDRCIFSTAIHYFTGRTACVSSSRRIPQRATTESVQNRKRNRIRCLLW